MSKTLILGVDAGGTFTDFVGIELSDPVRIRVHKTPSTPAAPEAAILSGLRAMGLDALSEGDRLHIIHGSTVATNAVLEGEFARTAFITNQGLADMLMLARQTRPRLYRLDSPRREAPVSQELCFEAGGRLGADGETVEPLGTEELADLVRRVLASRPQAVAINLLFSFLDDRFERQIADALAEADPSLLISRSSAVLPVYREYERGIATWLNAALGPTVGGYLERLREGLHSDSLQVMQSSGETMAAERAAESAVHLLLSGPAGGLTAMLYLARQCALSKMVSLDMGGTSTDVALLAAGLEITTENSIADFPVAVPMVDMHTIGAGGGSIAWIDSGGMLQVGPRSAGAEPGPACYGKGGRLPTVTDANLLLGRLPADSRLAGDLSLDENAAREAIATLANEAGLSLEDAAQGIIRVANEQMAAAIRLLSVNRGHDPGQFVLASFGGAGGLHVCAIAELMGMDQAMIPVHGGVLSALGMAVADRGRQFTRTFSGLLSELGDERITRQYRELSEAASQELEGEGLPLPELREQLSADLRYRGQSYTLNVPWSGTEAAVTSFHVQHEARFGYRLDAEVELVNLRVRVTCPQQSFQLPEWETGSGRKEVTAARVSVSAAGIPLHARDSLATGVSLRGPAIITEYAATSFIDEGWCCERDEMGNLHLRRE